MGCLQSFLQRRSSERKDNETPQPKVYSWDTRPKLDPADYTIENIKDETVGRTPGQLNGQQFIIRNCEDSNIFLFDHTNTITIDDCKNCRIFLGPIKTTVFIRNCKDCRVMLACQQFRIRDCQRMEFFLACITQPIIEASTGLKFGCFQYHYPELEGQFHAAGTSIFNNNWSNIHDFTPVPGENNYSYAAQDVNPSETFPVPVRPEFERMQICMDAEKSVVPVTLGNRRKPSSESCLVVFFHNHLAYTLAKEYLQEMSKDHPSCVLVQTKKMRMETPQAVSVFGSDTFNAAVQLGDIIGFEYNGDAACQLCKTTLNSVTEGTANVVFCSRTAEEASSQIENFYNFADMQMSV